MSCRRTTPAPRIDPVELESKRVRVLKATEHQHETNPHIKEYHQKLSALYEGRTKSEDDFINWITGLNSAAMYLALNSLQGTTGLERVALVLSAGASFLGLISAVAYKFLAVIRFNALQLEVSILKNLADGHDINAQLSVLANSGTPVSDEDTQKLLRNINENLDFLDPNQFALHQKPAQRRATQLAWAYRLALIFFLLGVTLLMVKYALGLVTTPTPFAL